MPNGTGTRLYVGNLAPDTRYVHNEKGQQVGRLELTFSFTFQRERFGRSFQRIWKDCRSSFDG